MKRSNYIIIAVVIVILVAVLIQNNLSHDKSHTDEMMATTTEVVATSTAQPSSYVAPAVMTHVQAPAKAPVLVISQETLTFNLGEKKTIDGYTITVKSIKDTRCTGSTRCAEVGDARVLLGVIGPMTTKNVSLIEGQAFIVDDAKIILNDVKPERSKDEVIADGSYRFTITIESAQ
jgi:hypothetical protein